MSSAELLSGAVDGASRIAARTLRSPVVKAMAFGTGVSRAAQRLREGERGARRPCANAGPPPAEQRATKRSGHRAFRVFKRLFWLVLGFTLGVASSWAVTRRVRRIVQRFAPADVVDRWSDNVRSAVSEGRDAMRTREVELNSGFDRATGQ